MLFCCLWRNVETSCHKHFVDVSREQQTSPLTTSGSVTTCHGSAAACWQHLAAVAALTARSEARYWLRIAISAYTPPAFDAPAGGRVRLNIQYCHVVCDVWYGKKEWLGYPMLKTFWRYVYSFWHNSRTWQTADTQTDTAWRHGPRLCIASRGKYVIDEAVAGVVAKEHHFEHLLNQHFQSHHLYSRQWRIHGAWGGRWGRLPHPLEWSPPGEFFLVNSFPFVIFLFQSQKFLQIYHPSLPGLLMCLR